jgi:hypothetical protein
MRIRWGAVCLSFTLLTQCLAFGVPAGSELPGAATTGPSKASVVRLIAAAERTYFRTHERYAIFQELVQSGQIEKTANQSSTYLRALKFLNLQSESHPVEGFVLGLAVTPDGRGYRLSLTQSGEACRLGWFADETGTLYEGKAVGCADKIVAHVPNSWSPPDIDAAVPPVRSDVACPLGLILHETGQRVDELVENLQRFTADERIDHVEFGKDGKQRRSTKQLMHYVAQLELNSTGTYRVEEYRSARGVAVQPPLTDTGTAAFALIFHPRQVEHFDIRCEGQTDVDGVPAWQMRFEENPDAGESFHAMRIDGSVYDLKLKGRAWIAADAYQVLRLQTDLVAPVPKIDLQVEHLDISYAPVEFRKHKLQLWLPKQASLFIGYRGHRYERVHSFSDFQLFNVDTQESVKEPSLPPEERSQN